MMRHLVSSSFRPAQVLAVVCLASLVGIASSTNTKAQASELLATITTLLETEPRLALPVRQRKAELTAYYVEQGGEALWIGTGRMPQLIAQINSAEDVGLLPQDYSVTHLTKLLAAATAATDPTSQAVIELYFSSFFMKFASDIKIGRLLPGRVDKDLFWKAKKVDLVAAMTGLAGASSLADFIQSWEPQIPEYRALRTTLKTYREIAAQGGWPESAVRRSPEARHDGRASAHNPRTAGLDRRRQPGGGLRPGPKPRRTSMRARSSRP